MRLFSKIRTSAFSSFVFLGLTLALFSCSGKQVDPNEPASLFQEAEDEIKSDHYQLALDHLRILKNKFPYSNFAIEAQLKMADVYFLQESYPEAAASYEAFRELHPKHDKVPYAMYRAAQAYFNDTPNKVARDLGSAQKALDAFNEFVTKFPADPRVTEARAAIASIRGLLADKEIYIGDFYSRTDAFDSAAERYKKAIALYPETAAAQLAKPKLENAEKKVKELQASADAQGGSK